MNPMTLVTKVEGPPVPQLPVALDATVASLRPSGRRLAVITVAPVPGSANHTSIKSAINEARLIQAAKLAADGRAEITPNDRVDIIVRAGSYGENIDLAPWVHLYGQGSGVVTITQVTSGAQRGTFEGHHSGYVEGVRIVRSSDAPAITVYPVHTATSHTSIWADVVFDHQVSAQAAFGSDGGENGYTCFYRCRFIGGTNIHGDANQARAKTVAFIQCVGLYMLGFNSMHPTAPDHVWVVGTTAESINVQGAGTTLHISGSTISGTVTAAGSQDTRSDWPVPTGGLSAYDRLYYGIPLN